ncbi:unnamed protein product [Sympodiomycopsis kandeliae]
MASGSDNTRTARGGGGTLSKLKNRFSRSFSRDSPASTAPASDKQTPAPVTEQSEPTNDKAAEQTVAPTDKAANTTGESAQPVAAGLAPVAKDDPAAVTTPQQDHAPSASSNSHYATHARSLNGVKQSLRQIYPAHEPFKTGTLKVSDASNGDHEIYWELSGKQGGYPVVYLHGGPGGGTTDDDRRWFDPNHYQILVFDQRGAGKSTPSAELKGNTTWDLVEDVERLRKDVAKVEKWHVFGGSWGSTLSLAYAQTHPERVSALILRGIFSLRRSELEFFYQEGSGWLWPEQFKPFLEHIPEPERKDMIGAYYSRLTSSDPAVQLEAARKWSTWENATSKLYLDEKHISKSEDDKWTLEFARIESHFFHNRGWMEDGQLLKKENVAKIAHIPTVIVQGRYDVVCPAKSAFDLNEVWKSVPGGEKNLEFFVIPDAGHSAREPGIADKLIYATDKFKAVTA